ncbi:MAG: glycosyltransferase family 4 protein [Thiohalocapsa sp.]
MRIALISPLYESCPPRLYGGTERVVFYLSEELVRLGHDVTLFASGDSQTSAALQPCCKGALRLDAACKDPLVHHLVMFHRVRRQAAEFDLLHFHTEYLHFPLFAEQAHKTLTTFHGRLDLPDLPAMLNEFPMLPLVSISNAQRRPVASANWQGTVLHGLPPDLHRLGDGGGGYLAFLGRISPEKGVAEAIAIARRVGMPLQIAAKVDPCDREYYDYAVKPALADAAIEYVGEIGEREKTAFLGDAAAMLFPIAWPEPFGLVMIEAMANGTPVIAFPSGSAPEVIEDGLTGFLVDGVENAAKAAASLGSLDRAAIRRRFEERFTAERMARDYVSLYERTVGCDWRAIALPDVSEARPAEAAD